MVSQLYNSPIIRETRRVHAHVAVRTTIFTDAICLRTALKNVASRVMPRISKILIANRGEIAIRIMRSCMELGVESVAVYSEADRASPHVRMADEAYLIGPAPAAQSYLRSDALIDAATKSGADAVHPGYGFLSENAAFAAACERAGLVFIGPSAAAIAAMGDKTKARELMLNNGVPVVPGSKGAVEDATIAQHEGARIGYPVMLKAAAGGGGKGMRLVRAPQDLPREFNLARNEAAAAFGDGRVFVEKYLEEPRHIEVQVLADSSGNMVHLFERECSIQRRHQKVMEEAPSPFVTPPLRDRMCRAAVQAAAACGYVNAGTVEFLAVADGSFYFMEMNTRLQVEHPVTEWITGIDIVTAQIRIAEGAPLPFKQSDITVNGHALECRIYAEDPLQGFAPDPGTLLRHRPPAGFGVRVDSGVEEAGEVSMHYDPMIAKVSTWGRTRAEATGRMDRALAEYAIAGVSTTRAFCRHVLQQAAFRRGDLSTHYVENHMDPDALARVESEVARAAVVAHVLAPAPAASELLPPVMSEWRRGRQ